jgi:methylthioribose-1-phosphate isomerase
MPGLSTELFIHHGGRHLTPDVATEIRPIYWSDGTVKLLDQTLLPIEEVWLELDDYRSVVSAIKEMRIRGAPAIGVAGAYAVALAAAEVMERDPAAFTSALTEAAGEIRSARPTGANLEWAVDRMMRAARDSQSDEDVVAGLVAEAQRIQDEDVQANHTMGRYGADLIPADSAVLTHCNAGALATGGYGTALGVIQTAWTDGKISQVFATETRPFMQGARLTAWELVQADIDATLIPDSSAGQLMRRGEVDAVVVGADRIAANGDVANKIGTYSLAVLADANGVPMYVAAPTTTVDMSISTGDDIPIEERPTEEVTHLKGVRIPPEGIAVSNTAFDVTPHRYVTAIVTEMGVVRHPYEEGLKRIMDAQRG